MRTPAAADVNSVDVDAIRRVLREHPVTLAILFCSHATGDAHAGSDVDLAVEFPDDRPTDAEYNEVFLGLSADLSAELETNDVDLVDLATVSPDLAASIFDTGVLLLGEETTVDEWERELTTNVRESPRERLDAALERIDAHLDESEGGVAATGSRRDGR